MMMLIKKTFFLFLFSIFLILIFGFFFATEIKGQECSSENSNEPSSLRPYPGDPCNKEIGGAMLCGNDLMVTDQIVVSPPAGFAGCQKNEGDPSTTKDDTYNCGFQVPRGFTLGVDTSEAELPIAGNTEDELSDKEKVNEYVSWYLNGIINRMEDWPLTDKSEGDRNKIINFSGPIRKLLPLDTQNEARTEQVEAVQGESQERHNQLVYCTYGFDSIVPDWTQFPGPCDSGTLGDIAAFLGLKKELRLSSWSGEEPPQREDYKSFNDYYRAFREWRGSTCLTVKIPEKISFLGAEVSIPIIGGKEFFFCFDNPTQRNFWADLYPFIPYTSTEDRMGKLTVSQPIATLTEVEVLNPQYNKVKASNLYFPHLEEDKGLAELLQTTYKAKGLPEEFVQAEAAPKQGNCKFLQLRTNAGDSLKGTPAEGDFTYTAKFNCTFSNAAISPTCTKTITFASQVKVYTPLAEDIWKKLVSGSAAVVRRIFPKLGTGGLGNIIDYPTSTKVTYSVAGAKAGVGDTEIYIPHMGGVSEYFLKGIQTLLRPKGFGEEINFGSVSSTTGKTNCDKTVPDIFLANTIDKQSYYQLALKHVGGQAGTNALECYNDTIRRALNARVNPAFALVIWYHESDASNYNISKLDFGAAFPSPEGYGAQIDEFFNRAKNYTVSDTRCDWTKLPADKKDNMHVFSWIYRTGRCDPGFVAQDEYGGTGEDYYETLRRTWNLITSCPFPKSPTDMSCPQP